jgi:hypothetical protein
MDRAVVYFTLWLNQPSTAGTINLNGVLVTLIHSFCYITCFPGISVKARLKDFNVPNYGGLSDNNLLPLSHNITSCSPGKTRGWKMLKKLPSTSAQQVVIKLDQQELES